MTRGASRAGFTLLEVLLAVMVVGIIAAAVLPVVADHQKKAVQARLDANVAEVSKAILRYESEHLTTVGYIWDQGVPGGLIAYRHEDAEGFIRQLEGVTDRFGNVQGDAFGSQAGAYGYGPYLGKGQAFAPASMLLAKKSVGFRGSRASPKSAVAKMGGVEPLVDAAQGEGVGGDIGGSIGGIGGGNGGGSGGNGDVIVTDPGDEARERLCTSSLHINLPRVCLLVSFSNGTQITLDQLSSDDPRLLTLTFFTGVVQTQGGSYVASSAYNTLAGYDIAVAKLQGVLSAVSDASGDE
jgi:prepilin-type N-terminal cleavage/methylation domain-containing protein